MFHQDYVRTQRDLKQYEERDVTFRSTREAKFIKVLVESLEQSDEEAFTGAVYEFDQVTKLDNWKTAILVKIKRGLQQAPGLT
jgi:alpha-soluble NSF attachment protein